MRRLFFAHANGFPAAAYRRLFSFLADDFDVAAIDRLGHDERFPVTDGWHFLRDELRGAIEKRFDGPVIGVGHSLGGVLHLMVSLDRPELYERIILLDAPVISRLSSHGLRFLKLTGLMDSFSPARITRFRRNFWQTRDEAFEHFRQKPVFRDFDPDALRDYVEGGTVPAKGGYELFFSPTVEAKIYNTIPHHMPRFRGRISVPTTFVGASDSREVRLARAGFMRKHFAFDHVSIPGSHLFPFERPQETAEIIRLICSS